MSNIIKKYLKLISFFVVLFFLCQLFAPAFGLDLTDPNLNNTITDYSNVNSSAKYANLGEAYLDPVLKIDITKLTSQLPPDYSYGAINNAKSTAGLIYFYTSAGRSYKSAGIIALKDYTDPAAEAEGRGKCLVVKNGETLEEWGKLWADVVYVEAGGKIKVAEFSEEDKTGGWLEIHAKVIRIDGEIEAFGSGYRGTDGGMWGKFGDGGVGECSGGGGCIWSPNGLNGQKGGLPEEPQSDINGPYSPALASMTAINNGGAAGSEGNDGKPGGSGANGNDADSASKTFNPKDLDGLSMGSGGQGSQGGGGGGGGGASGTGDGGNGGYGGWGSKGGNGGGIIKLYAKYSLILNAKVWANGQFGMKSDPGKKGWPGINGGKKGGDGGNSGYGGGGAGGGILLKCYSPLVQLSGIHSSIGTLGMKLNSVLDVRGAKGPPTSAVLSTYNSGIIKIAYTGNAPAANVLGNTKTHKYKLPLVDIVSPAGGEYYSKNVPIKWIVKSGQASLSGWGRVSYLDNNNKWQTIVQGINSSKAGIVGTVNWGWNWDSSNVSTSNNVQLKIEASDINGNVGEAISRIFTVDNEVPKQPTKVTVGSPSVSVNGFTNENPKIIWEGVKEQYSGVGKVQVAIQRKDINSPNYKENLKLDKNYKFAGFDSVALAIWIDVSNLSSIKESGKIYNGDFTMDASTWPTGIYHFYVRVIDRAGNVSPDSLPSSKWSSTYNCDKLGPVMLLYDDFNKLFLLDILEPGRWINQNTFKLEVTDDGSGILKYGYAVNDLFNNQTWPKVQNTSKDSTTITLSEGQSKLWFYAEDKLGNKNENWPLFVFPWWIRVDTKLPTVGLVGASSSNIIGTASDEGFTDVPQTGSGINTIEAWLYTTTGKSDGTPDINNGTIQYWNGSSWVTGSQSTAKVYKITPDSSGNWAIDATAMNLKSNWPYRIVLKAIDKAGNESAKIESDFTVSSTVTQASSAPGNLKISVVNTNQIKLSWSAVLGATSYTVYRAANAPDFTKQTATFTKVVTGTSWTDTTAKITGDVDNNYFYFVTAKNSAGESTPSNRVGEFDFKLVYNTGNTSVNGVTMVLDPAYAAGGSAISTASDLVKLIPNATAVSYFDSVNQKYMEHSKGMPFNNFSVKVGYPYFVTVNKAGTWTVVGGVPTPPTFTLIYNASATSVNSISLKLNKANITYAESLAQAVPNCSAVSYFDASAQKTMEHPKGTPINNFATKIGYPYFVTVTGNGGF